MPDDGLQLRGLEPGDAGSLVACFERCYGGTYVGAVFQDADAIAAEVEEDRLCSVVAVDPAVGVVGHMGLSSCAPGARVAEMGNTVVDPRYRGRQLVGRLTAQLARRCLERDLVGFLHYPTTAHPIMQTLAEKGGGAECGVLLDYIPAETRYVGFDGEGPAGRVAVVGFWHALAALPDQALRPPDRHREVIADFYARAGLPRRLDEAPRRASSEASRLQASFEARRGLHRIAVEQAGPDLVERVRAATREAPEAPALVDLSLADPGVDAATEALSRDGFCFGAVLPYYDARGDVLRLQRPWETTATPELATATGRALYAYSLRDRARGAATS